MNSLRPYPALIGLFGQLSTSPTPRPIPLFCAWGVHLDFQGPMGALAITRVLGPTPLIMGILGHLDPLGPLQSVGHNPQPTVCTPQTVGPLGPFWPKSNEAKGGHVGPKPQVGPPQPNLAPNLISPTNCQKDPRTHIGHFQPLAFGNHQRPPDKAQQCFPFI
ncbi:hypothetical protein O181_077286 [Austropuccinia psidii MF-1]|uniref:Uncharacterized protein n=1 Tax=Austropuccinia psidii MF-1 TaxID=1389203 RepID=A0A9Q3FC16_9BASI|nr:hypothetical protein [Austropuccinia psidii MF-1]